MAGSLSVAVALALAAVWFGAGGLTASPLAPAPATAAASKADAEFIRRSCKATRYRQLCERSLSGYAGSVHRSPRQLARLALSLSLQRAGSASAFVSRLKARKGGSGSGSESLRQNQRRSRDAGAVRDCAETMRDSVERLRQSAREMGRMGRARSARFAWHLSNVQTWVSGALTDQTTCLDSLAQNAAPDLRSAVRSRLLAASQLTSNALALINRLAPAPAPSLS